MSQADFFFAAGAPMCLARDVATPAKLRVDADSERTTLTRHSTLFRTRSRNDEQERRYMVVGRMTGRGAWMASERRVSLLDGDNHDANGDATLYTYDARNLKTSEAFPGHGPTSSSDEGNSKPEVYRCNNPQKSRVERPPTCQTTDFIVDIVHLGSRLIGKRLGKEERFSQYRQACFRCANRLRQHSLAHLKPPRPKTKACYMNLDPEIRWGQRALWLLDRVRSGNLTDRQRKRLNREEVETQLGWLEEYREEVEVWMQLCEIGQASCAVVRRCGYSQETVAQLRTTLGPGTTPAARELIAE